MKKKIISVFTATRAEYGLLKPIITKLTKVQEFDVRIVVSGAHLSPDFGYTYKEIEEDGFKIDKKIDILLSSDDTSAISKSMGLALISFSDYFSTLEPDLLLVLGDRYESLAVSIAAMNEKIPIAHLHGGEKTQGAVDDVIRHAITKLSYIHFTSTREYKNRVIQLGEHPDRVYEVGAIGIENILNEKLLSREELEKSLGVKLGEQYAVATYHPVTLEKNTSESQVRDLLDVCIKRKDICFIFTKANADEDGRKINKILEEYSKYENIKVYSSLGMKRYLSALKYAKFVIGNSSSGILEAPSFKIATINIGDRQKGRLRASSVIDVENDKKSIEDAINLALSKDFEQRLKTTVNPYGDGNTSSKIIDILKKYMLEGKIDLKKEFYDVM